VEPKASGSRVFSNHVLDQIGRHSGPFDFIKILRLITFFLVGDSKSSLVLAPSGNNILSNASDYRNVYE
jgi:hypothetical protein